MSISFRDPSGRVRIVEGRVLRFVNASGAGDIRAALSSATLQKFIDARRVVRARIVEETEAALLSEKLADEGRTSEASETNRATGTSETYFASSAPALVLEHERIAFQSFPYEWPPEMLH